MVSMSPDRTPELYGTTRAAMQARRAAGVIIPGDDHTHVEIGAWPRLYGKRRLMALGLPSMTPRAKWMSNAATRKRLGAVTPSKAVWVTKEKPSALRRAALAVRSVFRRIAGAMRTH
jgi:hypothetical protein